MYRVELTPDDNGTVMVTCPDLAEVITFGDDEEDALGRAADAIEEALAGRIARREEIPAPASVSYNAGRFGRRNIRARSVKPLAAPRLVGLPPLTVAKVELYRAMRAGRISKAELGRRLGWHGPQVDRLLDLDHRSTIEHLDQALRAIGKRLEVRVADAA